MELQVFADSLRAAISIDRTPPETIANHLPLALFEDGYRAWRGLGVLDPNWFTVAVTFRHLTRPRELVGSFTLRTTSGSYYLVDGMFSAQLTLPASYRIVEQWGQGGWLFLTDYHWGGGNQSMSDVPASWLSYMVR